MHKLKLLGIPMLMIISLLFLYIAQLRFFSQHRTTTPAYDDDTQTEKFMTFLPHSGLHNQRISLINAMVVAKALNRTLVMPKLNIGHATAWKPSPRLERQLNDCTKHNPSLTGCSEYKRFVPVSVATVLDLSPLEAVGVRTHQRHDMRLGYFERHFNAQPHDIYTLDDQSRYSYRFFDKDDGDNDLKNFEQRINLSDLRNQPERFLAFGSLFGSDRLHLETVELLWLRSYLLSEVAINHSVVLNQTLDVVAKLGGPGQFTSAHLRLGDGFFKNKVSSSMIEIRKALRKDDHGKPHQPTLERLRAIAQDGRPSQELLQECLLVNSTHSRLRVIYMATDAQQPRISLPQLFDEFVCLFSLADFPEVIQGTLTASPLNPNTEEQYPSRLGPLLLPLIDAEIATHASYFVGTPKSTFSKYIIYRNARFRNVYPQLSS